jgi:hypothetical protein
MKSFYKTFALMLTNFLVLLVCLNLLLFAYSRIAHFFHARLARRMTANQGFITGDSPWRDRVLAIESFETVMLRNYDYDSITQLRLRPLHGRFVNVEKGGYRRVQDQGPWPPDQSSTNIFVFGGSTAFGFLVDDDQTIASYLQRYASAAHGRIAVYNFGRPGYTSTQESLLYLSLLRDGFVPKVAVFIDGLNECQEWTPNPPRGAHWPDEYVSTAIENAKRSQSSYLLLLSALPMSGLTRSIADRFGLDRHTDDFQPVPSDVPGYILGRWLKNKKVIEVLSRGYGVSVNFVWQPVAAYKYDLSYFKFPRSVLQAESWVPAVYPAVEKLAEEGKLDSDFLNLADMQEDEKRNLYVDGTHYNAEFSDKIASRIYQFLKSRAALRIEPPHQALIRSSTVDVSSAR